MIRILSIIGIALLMAACQEADEPVKKESELAAKWREQLVPQLNEFMGPGFDVHIKDIEEFEEDGVVLLRSNLKVVNGVPLYAPYDGSADLHARMVELGWEETGFPRFGLRAPETIKQFTAVGDEAEIVIIAKPRYKGADFEILHVDGDTDMKGKARESFPFPRYIEIGTQETDKWILEVFEADRKSKEDSKLQSPSKIEIK